MNNTKWEELRNAMYELGPFSPQFRCKDLDRKEPSRWDGEWFYHFRECPYESIEHTELKVLSPEQRHAVRERLCAIHLPGVETDDGFRIYGWIKPGEVVDYIK